MVFPHSPWAEMSLNTPSAEISQAVSIVVPFVIAVFTHVSPRDCAFCREYGIEAVDFGCDFFVESQWYDGPHREGGCEFAVRSDDASATR